ncbi:hypothetical protein NP493_188g00036 [Ridgeia piscesae]|uniref:GH18 domain-containing protein n=1 Tax=Ridgeia piscesae TaxID=27915 RepID=A0AAD9UES8_RIDPI|nr:hypothetical protein NP493_188g00036 [Ridgeia piscesae]
MVYSLDADDFSGKLCGEGQYPLISAMRRALFTKRPVPTTTTTTAPTTTTTTTPTTTTTTTTTTTPKPAHIPPVKEGRHVNNDNVYNNANHNTN